MSEVAASKPKTEVLAVEMTDGRTVNFPGKRKVSKETLIDASKIELAGDILQFQAGALSTRMDFRNGETRTLVWPLSLIAQVAGHGGEQKSGDNLASSAANPLSEEDMVVATEDLFSELAKGNWGKARGEGGGGVAGAGIVVQAIVEATGKDVVFVKAWLQKKIDSTEGLSRKALYDSFRVAGTKTGEIIKRLEEAKLAKTAKVDANGALDEMEEALV